MTFALRYPVLLLALLALACGGADTGTVNPPTPPPPQPPSPTPASLAIQAGDGQRSEPGDILPIRAAVIVRNAAGNPISGVAVTFTIDSGGGSLSATAATTGVNGVAESGTWTLGMAEGRNTLTVSVGSLAPIKIAATAAVSGGSVPATTLASSGGSITVSQPGPLHGFSLNLPAGAYTTSTTWTIAYRSASTIPKTAVMNPVSPIIHLTGTATSYSAKLLTITIPATIPANTFPVIILRDPRTGLIEALPTTDYDSVSVTAVTRHLNAAFLLMNNAARSAGLRGSSALRTGGYDVEVVVSTLTRAQLDADIDTGFRPGTDDWGFDNPGTFLQPDGICGGMTLTAMWYFANRKKPDGDLFHRLDRALGVPISNRGGIRWSSRVNAAQPDNSFTDAMQAATESAKKTPGVTAGQIRYDMIKAQLVMSQLPQLIVVANTRFSHAVMAYRTVGSNIYVTDPNISGGLDQKVRFGGAEFVPYNMASTTSAGPLALLYYVAGLGASALYDWGKFPDEYVQAVDGSIDEDVFPVTEMRNRFGVLSDTIYVADTMATWVQCAACQSYPAPAGLTGTSGPLAKLALFRDPGGNLKWTPRGEGFVNPLDPSRLASPGDYPFGYAVFGNIADNDAWIDWKTFIVRKLVANITPAAPTDIVGNPISFEMQVTPNRLPRDVIYQWDFNDGTAIVSVNNNNKLPHAFPREGSFVIAAQILDARTQQPIAKTTTAVVITQPLQVWKFTSTSTSFSSRPVADQSNPSDSRWVIDSTIIARIANGITQGGFRIVDQAFTPTGSPSRTAPVGFYLLEGISLTYANLLEPVTENNFIVTTFPGAPLAIPAAPRVSGWNLVQQSAPTNPLCNTYENSYVFNGTVTQGRLTALRVPICVLSDNFPSVNGQRLMSMDVDVTFAATTATGTINVIYYFYGNGTPLQAFQRSARLTFTATRLVP